MINCCHRPKRKVRQKYRLEMNNKYTKMTKKNRNFHKEAHILVDQKFTWKRVYLNLKVFFSLSLNLSLQHTH